MNGIADTGFIVAFGNRNDRFHRWAVELAEKMALPLLTCEAVLAEAAFHLRAGDYVLALVEEGLLKPAFDLSRNLGRLAELAARYRDRKPDLADLCLIRMSELYRYHLVLTVDETDFRIYRRNGRDVIPLLCPPKHR